MAPAYEGVDSPARSLDNQHSENARDTLRRADEFAFLLDLDQDGISERVHERPLLDAMQNLRAAAGIARDLRALADEFDVARAAMREGISAGLENHDRQMLESEKSESPRLIPASASGRGIRG